MDNGVLTNLLNTFVGIFSLGYGRLLPDALHLLAILASLEMVFAGLWWAFDGGQRVEVELLKKVLIIGFFIWIVSNYKWFIELVIGGFINVGERAGGRESNLLTNPSLIIDYGFAATDPIFQHIHNYSRIGLHQIPDIILSGFSGLLIILAYFALAVVVFITYLEFYIISILGLILVPFGVFRHTSFLSEKVFGAVIAFGIRLMVLAFILAVIEPTLAKVVLPKDPTFKETLTVFLTSFTIAGLSWHAPGIASGLLAGSPSLGLGAMFGTGLAATAGVAGIGAATGINSAVHAGVEKTKAAVGAGFASITHTHGGGGGSAGGGVGGSQGGTTSSGASAARSTGSTSSASSGGKGSGAPSWAQELLLARHAVPSDGQPGPGIVVPLKRD